MKNNYILYDCAVHSLGPTMSREEFFDHGWPGFDDETRLSNPYEIKLKNGILVYRMDTPNKVEVFGYRNTPLFGKRKIKLIKNTNQTQISTELKQALSLEKTVSILFK